MDVDATKTYAELFLKIRRELQTVSSGGMCSGVAIYDAVYQIVDRGEDEDLYNGIGAYLTDFLVKRKGFGGVDDMSEYISRFSEYERLLDALIRATRFLDDRLSKKNMGTVESAAYIIWERVMIRGTNLSEGLVEKVRGQSAVASRKWIPRYIVEHILKRDEGSSTEYHVEDIRKYLSTFSKVVFDPRDPLLFYRVKYEAVALNVIASECEVNPHAIRERIRSEAGRREIGENLLDHIAFYCFTAFAREKMEFEKSRAKSIFLPESHKKLFAAVDGEVIKRNATWVKEMIGRLIFGKGTPLRDEVEAFGSELPFYDNKKMLRIHSQNLHSYPSFVTVVAPIISEFSSKSLRCESLAEINKCFKETFGFFKDHLTDECVTVFESAFRKSLDSMIGFGKSLAEHACAILAGCDGGFVRAQQTGDPRKNLGKERMSMVDALKADEIFSNLFKFVGDKTEFIAAYTPHLQKRLLKSKISYSSEILLLKLLEFPDDADLKIRKMIDEACVTNRIIMKRSVGRDNVRKLVTSFLNAVRPDPNGCSAKKGAATLSCKISNESVRLLDVINRQASNYADVPPGTCLENRLEVVAFGTGEASEDSIEIIPHVLTSSLWKLNECSEYVPDELRYAADLINGVAKHWVRRKVLRWALEESVIVATINDKLTVECNMIQYAVLKSVLLDERDGRALLPSGKFDNVVDLLVKSGVIDEDHNLVKKEGCIEIKSESNEIHRTTPGDGRKSFYISLICRILKKKRNIKYGELIEEVKKHDKVKAIEGEFDSAICDIERQGYASRNGDTIVYEP